MTPRPEASSAPPGSVPEKVPNGRPAPDRVVRVIARGLVLHAARLDLPAALADPHVALDWHAGALAGPHVTVVAVRAHRLNPAAAAESQKRPHAAGFGVLGLDTNRRSLLLGVLDEPVAAAALGPYLAAGTGHQELRVLPHLPSLSIPHQPEGLAERPDLDASRAEQELFREGADVAPSLAPYAAPAQRHPPRRQRQIRTSFTGAAPGERCGGIHLPTRSLRSRHRRPRSPPR